MDPLFCGGRALAAVDRYEDGLIVRVGNRAVEGSEQVFVREGRQDDPFGPAGDPAVGDLVGQRELGAEFVFVVVEEEKPGEQFTGTGARAQVEEGELLVGGDGVNGGVAFGVFGGGQQVGEAGQVVAGGGDDGELAAGMNGAGEVPGVVEGPSRGYQLFAQVAVGPAPAVQVLASASARRTTRSMISTVSPSSARRSTACSSTRTAASIGSNLLLAGASLPTSRNGTSGEGRKREAPLACR
jgi:hypothetical protein